MDAILTQVNESYPLKNQNTDSEKRHLPSNRSMPLHAHRLREPEFPQHGSGADGAKIVMKTRVV